jgi:hypothetical protein
MRVLFSVVSAFTIGGEVSVFTIGGESGVAIALVLAAITPFFFLFFGSWPPLFFGWMTAKNRLIPCAPAYALQMLPQMVSWEWPLLMSKSGFRFTRAKKHSI